METQLLTNEQKMKAAGIAASPYLRPLASQSKAGQNNGTPAGSGNEVEMIGGIPHIKMDNKPYPGPLDLALGAMGGTVKYIATAPFSDRAEQRLAANRAGLDASEEFTVAKGIGAPTATMPKERILGLANPAQKPGRDVNGLITAESAKGIAAAPMERSGGIFGSADMKGVNEIMARENKARGEMIDLSIKANGGNGIGILPDYQPPQQGGMSIADLQSAMKSAGTRAERAAYGQALQTMLSGQNQTGLEQIRQQGIAAGHGVQMRGQDMAAMSDAARIAGNPVENELRKAQAGGIAAQTESYRLISDLQQKAAVGDQKAIAALRTINGKADDRFKTNVVGGGTNEIGQVQPQYLAVTGPDGQTRFVTPTGSQQTAKQGQAPASAIEYLKKNPGQAEAFKAKYGYLPEGF